MPLGLLLLVAILAGCSRNVAPPVPWNPEETRQLQDEVDAFEF